MLNKDVPTKQEGNGRPKNSTPRDSLDNRRCIKFHFTLRVV